jgi:exodeoxyribonuclease (lambda-induced)
MQHGIDTETEAKTAYEFVTGSTVEDVGFVDHPTVAMSGASPDGLIGDDGMLEIKCPEPQTHVRNLISGKVDMSYYPQMQGQMLVTGRKWCDWMSYHPDMPPVIVRVHRDNNYLAALTMALAEFHKKKLIDLAILKQKGIL